MSSFLQQKFGLAGKVALVTGSSQGLGKAMALALARAGADVIINGRDPAKLAPVVAEITGLNLGVRAHAIDVKLNGVFTACRAAGGHMLARGSSKIINIASLLTFFGRITVPGYAASKGAVGQLTKALSNEWASGGVNVNAIAPGYMRTDTTAALQADPVRSKEILRRIPAGRWGEPSDLEGAVVFLASSVSDYLSGHILTVDGGWCGR